jgi:hypothetical protein
VTQAATAKRVGLATTPQASKVAAKPPPLLKPTLVAPRELITTGSVLFKTGTFLPPALEVPLRRVGDWDLIRGEDGFAVERKLRQAGWHFFFMVPAVEASAFGLDSRKTFAKALRQITRTVEARGFNAVEVTAVKQRQWLGVQYVSITAHPRHVRNSPFLRDLDPHHYPKGLWDFKQIFTVRNRQAAQIKAM